MRWRPPRRKSTTQVHDFVYPRASGSFSLLFSAGRAVASCVFCPVAERFLCQPAAGIPQFKAFFACCHTHTHTHPSARARSRPNSRRTSFCDNLPLCVVDDMLFVLLSRCFFVFRGAQLALPLAQGTDGVLLWGVGGGPQQPGAPTFG